MPAEDPQVFTTDGVYTPLFDNGYNGTLYWDDLRFPASGINPAGSAAPPGQDTDTYPGTLLFDAAGTEVVAGLAQFPHGWAQETDIRPHVHWMKSTSASGNVYWQLRYKWMKIGEVADTNFTTLTSSTPIAGTTDTNTAHQHLISSFGDVTTAGIEVSDMLCWELSRVGGNGADTYGADARLLEFDIHIQLDTPGTTPEFSK
jgi:hypothetical protein